MTLNIVSSFNGVSDPDAARYIEAVEAADGQLLEFGVGKAINDFVIGCKADGIWDAIKASCILAGARKKEGAFIDLKTGTQILTNNGFADGDYNRKTGLKGDGTKYLNTNVKPSDGLQDSVHFSTYTTSIASSALRHYIGATTTTPSLKVSQIIDNGGAINFAVNMAGQGLGGPAGSANGFTGFFGAERSTSLQITGRYGGNTLNKSVASTVPNSLDYFVFCRNLNGAADGISDRAHTFYSIGESLDLGKLDDRVTRLMNLITYTQTAGLPDLSTMDLDAASYIGGGYRAGGTLS